jgi:tight adherence protein B
MLGIIAVVFLAAFVIAALVLSAGGSRRSQQTQQTVRRLASLVTVAPGVIDEVLDDLRKPQHLSTIPWLDRLLLRAGIFPRLRLLLYQADLKWTVGTLILYAVVCWAADRKSVV